MGTNERKRKQALFQIALLCGGLILCALLFTVVTAVTEKRSLLRVTFRTVTGAETSPFYLTIASTPAERNKGLMYRKSLEPDRGMLFVFEGDGPRAFWMKNTYVSLDMLFIDSAKRVRGILPNVPILNEEPRRIPGIESMYVVELLAGTAAQHGITEGAEFVPHGPLPRGVVDLTPK